MLKESCQIYKTILYYTNQTQFKSIEHHKICKCKNICQNNYSMSKYYTAIFSQMTSKIYWNKNFNE